MNTAAPQPDTPSLRWGVSTSAFQIEGARTADGRGRTVWDEFVESPGKIVDGSTADAGPQSYRNWREDVALLADLGVDDYRFSVAWPRIQPDGTGPANPAGIAYYDRLVDELLAAGVSPVLTLYHWDLPLPLQRRGGWLNRDVAQHFADYAAILGEALGDRIPRWITINEAAMTTLEAYALGALAPGIPMMFDAIPAAHHQLLGHGLATSALRAHSAGAVGIANNHTFVEASSDAPEDVAAAAIYDALHNGTYSDPVLRGSYPDFAALGLPEQPVHDGDMKIIATPLDFYGVNYYQPTRISAPDQDTAAAGIPFTLAPMPDLPETGFGWPIDADSLRKQLLRFQDRYGEGLPPIIITESGASFPEDDTPPSPDRPGSSDAARINYLDSHIAAVEAAQSAGVDVAGYYVWSLLDNFEWAAGYTQRFGLVHVDTRTGERTLKPSFDWYRRRIRRARAD